MSDENDLSKLQSLLQETRQTLEAIKSIGLARGNLLDRGSLEENFGYAFKIMTRIAWVWQQKTFGDVQSRSVKGVLRHLAKEVSEAAEANDLSNQAAFREELADCQILLWECVGRASLSHFDFLEIIGEKLQKNMARQWPSPTADQPVEHIREGESHG